MALEPCIGLIFSAKKLKLIRIFKRSCYVLLYGKIFMFLFNQLNVVSNKATNIMHLLRIKITTKNGPWDRLVDYHSIESCLKSLLIYKAKNNKEILVFSSCNCPSEEPEIPNVHEQICVSDSHFLNDIHPRNIGKSVRR